jgi:hypothetical protein
MADLNPLIDDQPLADAAVSDAAAPLAGALPAALASKPAPKKTAAKPKLNAPVEPALPRETLSGELATPPAVGRTVIYHPSLDQMQDRAARANDAPYVPALVIQVLDENAVNLRVFPDSHQVLWKTQVPHESRRQEGQAYWTYLV